MSELKVNKISPETGTAITLGDSGDTFTIPSGAIITNSGTANGFGGGGILQMICKQDGERASDSTVTGITNDDDYLDGAIWSNMTITITPAATSSYIYFSGDFGICASSSYGAQLWVTYNHSGISETPLQGDLGQRPVGQRIENAPSGTDMSAPISVSGMFAPNTTNEITVQIRTGLSHASNGGVYFHQPTSSNTDTNDGATPMSSFVVWEISGDISPSITNNQINS